MGSQVLFDEVRQRKHVVVDEDDSLAARSRDTGVARGGQARVALTHDDEGTSRAAARALDHRRRGIARAVVNEHDLIVAFRDVLVEARLENALEECGTVVGAELQRRLHDISVSTAEMIRGTSR